MTREQAIDYLETTAHISPRTMSRAMWTCLRACARLAQRHYPGMAGYYDPEYNGPRAEPWRYLCPRARILDTIPQSERLRQRVTHTFPVPDPWCAFMVTR